MATYSIESDKLFICFKDMQVMEVYEIDSLHVAPVRQKYWTLLATVQLGDSREFEALQIVDRGVIRGRVLERLMQDLMSLGIMVNREGLCFLKAPESNISDQCQVEYYRMFDLFDWSKYRVKSRLNTRWTRNDIADGRYMLDYCLEMVSGKEAKFKVKTRQHRKQLDQLNRSHSEDIKELECKHSAVLAALEQGHSRDIQKLKRKHTEEIAAFELVKEEMEQKHDEDIEELKRKHTEELAVCECDQRYVKANEVMEEDSVIKILEDEFQLWCYAGSGHPSELLSINFKLMNYFQNLSPVWKLVDMIEPCHKGSEVYLPQVRDIGDIILLILPSAKRKYTRMSYLWTIAYCKGLLGNSSWSILELEDFSDTEFQPERKRSILFYDGSKDLESRSNNLYKPSLDDPEVCPSGFEGWGVFYVPGYGFKFGFVFVTDQF